MARYVVTTRRDARSQAATPSALDVTSAQPGVKVVAYSDPHMVTVDTTREIADELRKKLAETHFVEPEIRRGLE